jgi:hypothetical protein
MDAIRLQLVYDGAGPVHWDGGAGAFGLQDKAEVLHAGSPCAGGAVAFDFTLRVKAVDADAVVLVGDFAHGKPGERFLYLGWRNAAGNYAQRLKVPLSAITPDQVRRAVVDGKPLAATLVDHHPKATSTGANIGGTRPVAWALA